MGQTGTVWSATSGHLKLGINVRWDDVVVGTTSINVYVDYYVQPQAWGYADPQTLTVGGSISGVYNYTMSNGSGTSPVVLVHTHTIAGQGLSFGGGPAYTFSGVISGAYDGSAPSLSVNWTLPSRVASTPNVPGLVGNTALNSSTIRLQWSTPYDGGAPIDYYLLRVWTAGYSWSSPNIYSNFVGGNLLDLGGLTRATRYYWGIAAHNVIGLSAASNTGTGWYVDTPAAVPGTPSAPVITSTGQASVAVSFTLPDNGGSTITDTTFRLYTAATGGSPVATDAVPTAVTSYTFTNLLPLTNYWVSVSASNAVGAGPESARTPVTTNPSGYVKVSGVWRPYVGYVKVSGAWHVVQESYIKVGGAWRS